MRRIITLILLLSVLLLSSTQNLSAQVNEAALRRAIEKALREAELKDQKRAQQVAEMRAAEERRIKAAESIKVSKEQTNTQIESTKKSIETRQQNERARVERESESLMRDKGALMSSLKGVNSSNYSRKNDQNKLGLHNVSLQSNSSSSNQIGLKTIDTKKVTVLSNESKDYRSDSSSSSANQTNATGSNNYSFIGTGDQYLYSQNSSDLAFYRETQNTLRMMNEINAARDKERIEKNKEFYRDFSSIINSLSPSDLKEAARFYKDLELYSSLADFGYGQNKTLDIPKGWKTVDGELSTIINKANSGTNQILNFSFGFHCELIESIDDVGQKQYVLSFAGTDISSSTRINNAKDNSAKGGDESSSALSVTSSLVDLITPMGQMALAVNNVDFAHDVFGAVVPLGQTSQAIQVTEKVIRELSKIYGPDAVNHLTVVGHSLGGRLATEVSLLYGTKAYVYNPAEVSKATKDFISMGQKSKDPNKKLASDYMLRNAERITKVYSPDDILSMGQAVGGVYHTLLGDDILKNTVTIPHGGSHSIIDMNKSLCNINEIIGSRLK